MQTEIPTQDSTPANSKGETVVKPYKPRTIGEKKIEQRGGRKVVVFKTGPIAGHEDYVMAQDGSVRHAVPQFRGSKKNRKRFMQKIVKALNTPVPTGYRPMTEDETFSEEGYDLVFDLGTESWTNAPFHSCTIQQLRNVRFELVRGAKPTPEHYDFLTGRKPAKKVAAKKKTAAPKVAKKVKPNAKA